MLKKVIDLEFTLRSKAMCRLSLMMVGFAAFARVMRILADTANGMRFPDAVETVSLFFAMICYGGILGCTFSLFLLPCRDFSKTYFREQGSLIHTLPVSPETLLKGRAICDIISIAAAAATLILSGLIALGNELDDLVESMIDPQEYIVYFTSYQEVWLLYAILILTLLMDLLLFIWITNMSVSVGNSYFGMKGMWAGAGIFIISMICIILMHYVIVRIYDVLAANDTAAAGVYVLIIFAFAAAMLLYAAVMITAKILEKRLNLW